MLEFFFDCSSPWTYLAFHNIQPLAKELGVEISWRPILFPMRMCLGSCAGVCAPCQRLMPHRTGIQTACAMCSSCVSKVASAGAGPGFLGTSCGSPIVSVAPS